MFAEMVAQRASGVWTLWAHGGWNNSYAPVFAYGSADGSTPYSSGMSSGAGTVGPSSMFVVQPKPGTAPIGVASSAHTSGINVCMGDGSVRFLTFWDRSDHRVVENLDPKPRRYSGQLLINSDGKQHGGRIVGPRAVFMVFTTSGRCRRGA